MEPAEDAAAAAAPDSWETADIDGPMSRLILTARRVSSSPDLAEEQQDPPPAPPQTQGPAPAGDDSVAQVDQFLREALEKPRERLSVLRMEQDILKFIRDPRRTEFEFTGLPTSYLRLAAHRLAQHYFLQSHAIQDNSLPDGTGSRIILCKTSSECRLPAVRLADIPVNLPQEESSTVAKVAIKQRPQKNFHSTNSSSPHSSRDNLQKSVEERKEEYNRARARIFNNSSSGNAADGRPVEEVTLPNTLHRSSSLELNSSNRMGQGAEITTITLERSLTTTSASSRSNRSKIEKEPGVNRNRQNNRVAIFRDRESERKDPDYDRSYDRYMQRFDPGFGFNGGPYTIQPLYAPAVNYNTEFPQLGSAHRSPVAVEQQPRPIAQHMPGSWSAGQAPNAIGYGPPDGVMAPYSPGHAGAPVRSSVFMHASQQYAIPSRPGVPFVHPPESMGPFAQTHQQQPEASCLGWCHATNPAPILGVEDRPAMATASADVDRLQRRLASGGRGMDLPSNILVDLSRVMRSLYRLQGVLTAAEKQPFEASSQPRLRKIKQNVYDVEDILDELEDGSCSSSRGRKFAGASYLCSQAVFFFSSNRSVLHCPMVKKIKKIRKSLDHVSKDFILSLLHHSADGDQTCHHDVFDESAIIGRDNDKENLRALLLSNCEENFSIIPIVGLGGLGKTVLAQLIFTDKDVRYNFDLHIWINLNMTYNLKSIASAIISEANRTKQGMSQVKEEIEDNPQIIMNCLREVLHDKRCLIVLDSLWSTDEGELLHLKKMLRGTEKTKIIVTTSSENVAKLMHTIQPYKLGPLSEENCWTIFSRRVFCGGDNSDTTRTGKQIVNRCEGIPAVAHCLGSLVRDKGMSIWNDENQDLWKLERQFPFQINMFSSIKQIYYNMSSALKSCLNHLSIFPKGSDIRMENLIRQWAALGILGSTHGSLPVYSQGKKYIQELLSVFFLEEPNKSSGSGLNYTSASKVVNMHNLVHEFARYVTSHDLFIMDGERKNNDSSTDICTSRYAVLTRCNDGCKIRKVFLTSVRAMCLKDCGGEKFIEKIFSGLKHLHVLDLSRCSFFKIPSSIYQLTHLRYIDISSLAIQALPDQMSFLQNLEALDLSETHLQVLPDFVGTFQKLKYLNLQGCLKLHHLPSKLEDIKSLQHLNLSCCPAAHQLLESISGFQELRFLDMSSCTELESLPESFGRLTNLEDLILSKCTGLKKLPESFGDLCFLQFLNVSNCCELEEVPASIGRLASLEVLILSGCSRIQNLPQSFIDIAFLRILDLAGCVDLHINLGMLPHNNLENLNLDGCHKIYAMPGWTANFPKLHPKCLQTCDRQIQCLITEQQVCPSHNEVEIIKELNVCVHDETEEAMASQSCQQDGNSERTTKEVFEDSSARKSHNVPQRPTTPTGGSSSSTGAIGYACWPCSPLRKPQKHFSNVPAKEDPEGHLGQLKKFSLQELKVATDGFSNKNSLGGGGFGKVYKGRLADGSLVAVKRQKKEITPGAGELQFQAEVDILSTVVHRNLLRLRGFCITPTERLLVYPYMANGSVASRLRERTGSEPPLDWQTRRRIALGSAKGLSYLHDECDPKIIHHDVKAANILLDEDFEAVVGDFGLAKLMDYKDAQVTTPVSGTMGHIAPEYHSTGKSSEKTDVFSYGIMLLELVTGQRVLDLTRLANDDNASLLDWVKGLLKEKKLEDLVDDDLNDNYIDVEVESLLQIALLCTQRDPTERPKMSEVVTMLEGNGGLTERWEKWLKVAVDQDVELGPRRTSDWIAESAYVPRAVELSGPR